MTYETGKSSTREGRSGATAAAAHLDPTAPRSALVLAPLHPLAPLAPPPPMLLPASMDPGASRAGLLPTRRMLEVTSAAPAWPDLSPSEGPAPRLAPTLPRPPAAAPRVPPVAKMLPTTPAAPAPLTRTPNPFHGTSHVRPPTAPALQRPVPVPAAPFDPHALRAQHTPSATPPRAPQASPRSDAPRSWPPGLVSEPPPTRVQQGAGPGHRMEERNLEIEAPPARLEPHRPPVRMQPPRPKPSSGDVSVSPGKAVLYILGAVLLLLRGCAGCSNSSSSSNQTPRPIGVPSPTGRPSTSRRPLDLNERVRLQQLRREHENGEPLTAAEQRELTELERRERSAQPPR